MKRIYTIAGVALIAACLAGWAALAWGQTGPVAEKGPDPTIHEVPAATARPLPAGTAPDLPMPIGSLPPSPSRGSAPTGAGPAVLPPSGPALPGPAAPGAFPLPPAPGSPAGPLSPDAPSPARLDPLTGSLPAPMTPASANALKPPADSTSSPAGANGPESVNATLSRDRAAEPLVPADSSSGRQEPAVSLEWMGPSVAKIGVSCDYTLGVRNTCTIPVQKVQVLVRIPQGLTVVATEPRPLVEGNVLAWELGTLQPKQDRKLQIKLQADSSGDVMPQAWVTFTGSAVLRIKVREPKLALKVHSPEKALLGEDAAFTLTVSNPGDGSADQVKIHAQLSEGLEHARGSKIDFDIGNLAAGESRNVTLLCATRGGGAQKVEAVADADGGLHAHDAGTVTVSMAKLELQMVGPALRYLGRKAVYTIKVSNPGDAPAANVTVSDVVPEGFKVLAASHGGRHDSSSRTVSWFLGEVGPGQPREVQLEVQAINPGEHKHQATAVAARGLKAVGELTTRVEGLSALLVELVDTEDPIEVGSETNYEVRVTNTGSKVENDIKLVATVPDRMEFKAAHGPVPFRTEGKQIVFDAIDRLAPKADAIVRITVKALEPGTAYFKIQLTSASLVEPVIKTEATRIYSDAPDAKSAAPAGNP